MSPDHETIGNQGHEVWLEVRCYSHEFDVGSLSDLIGAPPTDSVDRNHRRTDRSRPAPSHGWFWESEHLPHERSLPSLVEALETHIGGMSKLEAAASDPLVRMEVVVYRWTSREEMLVLSPDSLRALGRFPVPVLFHVADYPN